MTTIATRPTRRGPSPVLRRLSELAKEFDQTAAYYANLPGEHNALCRQESRRAASQLRLVAALVRNGTYSEVLGAVWIRAAWRIVCAIGREQIK